MNPADMHPDERRQRRAAELLRQRPELMPLPPGAPPLADLLEELAPLAPYWGEPYAAPFVPIIAKALRLARAILGTDQDAGGPA
jgi:hypothetical protein